MVSTVPDIIQIEDDRTGTSVETLKRAFLDNLFYIQGKFPKIATRHDYYLALAYTVRDRLINRWLNTSQTYLERASRTVAYLSADFLLGPHLGQQPDQPGDLRQRQAGHGGVEAALRRPAGAGGGAGVGQRRPGSAGGLLH